MDECEKIKKFNALLLSLLRSQAQQVRELASTWDSNTNYHEKQEGEYPGWRIVWTFDEDGERGSLESESPLLS